MKFRNLLKNESTHLGDTEILGITCDSRAVKEGYAFVCINGSKADGHCFAKQALESGAAVVITEKPLGLEREVTVGDTRAAFAEMSAEFFGKPAEKLKIIGVTGTNGKTSVTYMLKSILEKAGYKTGIIGTIQNMIGDKVLDTANTTPDAYTLNSIFSQMVKDGCDFCIMEVSSHALDQKRVFGFGFEVAAFTNLTQDHLDYHITMENYLAAKKKLFDMCKTAVINLDDGYSDKIIEGVNCKVVSFSEKRNDSTYSAKCINLRPEGIEYEFVGFNLIKHIKLKTGGKFSVYNSMCAAAIAMELGVSVDTVALALGELEGVKGRAEIVPTNRNFTVIIDYAHTPDGLSNILSTFKEIKQGRLICLFGCGGDRDATKRPIMGSVAARYSDFVIVTSDNPRSEEPDKIISEIVEGMKPFKTPYVVIENRIEAINYAVANAVDNDIIILAGKGHENYQILKTGKIHLDEREVVREALSN